MFDALLLRFQLAQESLLFYRGEMKMEDYLSDEYEQLKSFLESQETKSKLTWPDFRKLFKHCAINCLMKYFLQEQKQQEKRLSSESSWSPWSNLAVLMFSYFKLRASLRKAEPLPSHLTLLLSSSERLSWLALTLALR